MWQSTLARLGTVSLAETRPRLMTILLWTVAAPGVAAGCGDPGDPVQTVPASFEHATRLEETAETSANASLGDLDGDGDVDLVVPHRDGGQSYVFVNDGTGGFEDRRTIGPAVSSTRAVALGDPRLDLGRRFGAPCDRAIGAKPADAARSIPRTGGRPPRSCGTDEPVSG